MNRRGFLASMISAGVAAAADPERLLWVPGQKLISLPSRQPRIARYKIVATGDNVYPFAYATFTISTTISERVGDIISITIGKDEAPLRVHSVIKLT